MQEIEDRISGLEVMIEEMDTFVKECEINKNNSGTFPGNLVQHKRTKAKNNRN